MQLARIVGLLLCLGTGASLILWMLTGDSRYRAWAWNLFRVGVAAAFVILALFALERVLAAA
ncbi:MAG: hypothetical protein FWG52_09180 [Proteobacteria bacterium]|jgi:hypothetical protein|nr:hypothetical protein [Pseudomonadota bacterium]